MSLFCLFNVNTFTVSLSANAVVTVPWWPYNEQYWGYTVILLSDDAYFDYDATFAPGVYLEVGPLGWAPYYAFTVMLKSNCGDGEHKVSSVALLVKPFVAILCGSFFSLMNTTDLYSISSISATDLTGDFSNYEPVTMHASTLDYATGDDAYVWVALPKSLWVFAEYCESGSWCLLPVWQSYSSGYQILDVQPFSTFLRIFL